MAPAGDYNYGTAWSDNCTYTTTADSGTSCWPSTSYCQYYVDPGTTSYNVITYTWTGNTIGYSPHIYGPMDPNRVYDKPVYNWGNIEAYIPPETPEQRAARELEEQRQAAIAEAARVSRLNREQKAEGLVKEILGELQYTAFKRHGYIDIPSGCDPTKRYRIRPYRMIGVVRKIGDQWVEQKQALCVGPREYGFVEGDVLATKIALCRFEEAQMLKVANLHERMAA